MTDLVRGAAGTDQTLGSRRVRATAPHDPTVAGAISVRRRASSSVLVDASPPRTYVAWGTLAAIDLHGCDRGSLADSDCIRTFVPAVIEAIGMKAHGPLALERFGTGELEGWSAMQFIETSTIVVHADEVAGRCFVDVFSCRPFDPEHAAAVAVEHFSGTPTVTVLLR
jgi:S-adenosylmethionine/arginine decarboxylase-like enzyme